MLIMAKCLSGGQFGQERMPRVLAVVESPETVPLDSSRTWKAEPFSSLPQVCARLQDIRACPRWTQDRSDWSFVQLCRRDLAGEKVS